MNVTTRWTDLRPSRIRTVEGKTRPRRRSQASRRGQSRRADVTDDGLRAGHAAAASGTRQAAGLAGTAADRGIGAVVERGRDRGLQQAVNYFCRGHRRITTPRFPRIIPTWTCGTRTMSARGLVKIRAVGMVAEVTTTRSRCAGAARHNLVFRGKGDGFVSRGAAPTTPLPSVIESSSWAHHGRSGATHPAHYTCSRVSISVSDGLD